MTPTDCFDKQFDQIPETISQMNKYALGFTFIKIMNFYNFKFSKNVLNDKKSFFIIHYVMLFQCFRVLCNMRLGKVFVLEISSMDQIG